MKLNASYTAILELHERLNLAKVPHSITRIFDGWKLENGRGDVVEHFGSYGSKDNLMEWMAKNSTSVEGWVTIDRAFRLLGGKNE